ncbi:MAG: multiheme c-type cytochrome, partial [Rhodothalassiaceae bacterium]
RDLARLHAFLKQRRLTHLPLFLDRGQVLGRAFGQGALPTTILIDPAGREVGRLIGSADWDSAAALALIRFAQSAPPRTTKNPNPATARLPDGYWHRPLAPQGAAPLAWSGPERSLAPQSCGSCHADKYAEWRSSYHARAFSPGLVGQLLGYDRAQASACLDCHAPLAEQKRAFEDGRTIKAVDTTAPAWGLAAAGNSCAGCHLRSHRFYGPLQQGSGVAGPSRHELAHGGVFRSPDFERSEFCGACHQHPSTMAINGKPLENTLAEWRESPQGAKGITCQQCHMPGRRHLWRGIHDPEMVASGLTVSFRAIPEGAEFKLTNSGVGHAFPTYITPRVAMHAVALDRSGNPLPATRSSHLIQRVVRFAGGRWVEESDSRLLPGDSATLRFPWPSSGRVRLWLEVAPDDFYDHEVYDALLGGLDPDTSAARLIAKADQRAEESSYRLFVTDLTRPD